MASLKESRVMTPVVKIQIGSKRPTVRAPRRRHGFLDDRRRFRSGAKGIVKRIGEDRSDRSGGEGVREGVLDFLMVLLLLLLLLLLVL